MSIVSFSFPGIASGAVTAQPKADVDRAEQAASVQEGQKINDTKAEQAAGIGQTDGDEHETEERDADGRRIWERTAKKKKDAAGEPSAESAVDTPHSRDATGECGNTLDLTG